MKIVALIAICCLTGFLAWNGNYFLAFFSILCIEVVSKANYGNRS